MHETKQPGGAISQARSCGDPLLESRLREFARMFEPKLLLPAKSMPEAAREAKRQGLVLAPHTEFDWIPDKVECAAGDTRVWTGTLVISARGNKPLGERVSVQAEKAGQFALNADVPPEFQGRSGCLVAEHPGFEFVPTGSGSYLVLTYGTTARLVDFPSCCGWFACEPEFGLPEGEAGQTEQGSARYLVTVSGPKISLVVRDLVSRQRVYVDTKPDESLRALVRSPVNPGNYIQRVTHVMRERRDARLEEFVRAWAHEDSALAEGLRRGLAAT